MSLDVLVTGGSGYIGSRLIVALLDRGHTVRTVSRPESVGRIPRGTIIVTGSALAADTVEAALRPGGTVVHLVGTPHPSPAKAEEFRSVDLASVKAAVEAARRVGSAHFVYVSVAQPAPVMKAYLAARAEGEQAIRNAGLAATILRPWYVLGPGHRWPLLLAPLYALASAIPSLRDGARRLGLVTLSQMVSALVRAVEEPPAQGSVRVVEVPEIRRRT
jgi:uncharacterized protein YbjT (DUF2867 family)